MKDWEFQEGERRMKEKENKTWVEEKGEWEKPREGKKENPGS
jgi:hypothetical protein